MCFFIRALKVPFLVAPKCKNLVGLCINTIVVIRSDWRNTGAGLSEKNKLTKLKRWVLKPGKKNFVLKKLCDGGEQNVPLDFQ